ncbi:MAG TPA: hypothetical protein VMU65_13680 [Candidatus Saccharimonadales bacterium]|nr:hypothetical protein [Candidatus Saccharimonadales bacterium]
MCIGCGEAEERHHERDMTYSDPEEAAANAGIDPEKALTIFTLRHVRRWCPRCSTS